MSFEHISGNETQKKILTNAVRENRVGHSYIFSGIEGIGKKMFALEFAKLINCTGNIEINGPCGCVSCTKIEKGIHPDVTLLEYKDEKTIKIDNVRADLEEKIFLSPFESRFKIFIVDNAERMNFNAQNAFLKTLEEPPDYSVIILVTGSLNYIAPTIRSRCQIIKFHPLPEIFISEHLKKNDNIEPGEITVATKLADGSIGRATKIDGEYLSLRKELLRRVMLVRDDSPSAILGLYEYLKIDSKESGLEHHKTLFDLLSVWLRDLLFLKLEYGPESITNSDLYSELSEYAGKRSFQNLLDKTGHLEESWYGLTRLNANKKLAFEDLFIKLSA